MNKSAALFISVILLTQIASYSFNEIQSDLDSEESTSDKSWEVSGRNSSSTLSWSAPISLDITDNVGYYSSLAIDSNDNLHVTYRDGTNGNLEYVAYDGSSWSTPVSLDSTDNVGRQSSLAIDSNDYLHVTYLDNTNSNLEYMTYDGSSWSTPVSLDSTDSVGYYSSLAIDSNDYLHVTYLDNTNDNLEYMTYDGSSWSTPVSLDSTDNVGWDSSLAIDSNDNLHVTYHDNTNANLEYMTYDGSSWSTPVSLDSTDNVGRQSSLAIDSNDNLHVTYLDETNYNLEYMTYDGSSWSTPVSLDSTDNVGGESSLEIDSNDNLHVTYLDETNYNLEYMTYDGSSWSTPVSLDSIDNVGFDSSLAIDSNDYLHVTYQDNTNKNLEYMNAGNNTGGNNTGGNNTGTHNDAHCLNVGNFSINSTYFVAIDLINTCNFGINYPGINASADNSGVSGFYNQTSWWYVIEANGTYNLVAQLEFDSTVLNGTNITLDFEAAVLNCGKNGTWHDCPDSQNSTLSYQFTFGNDSSSGNNASDNNTVDNNSTTTIPNYYFDESYGIYFNSVSNIMNGTYVPTTVWIHNYDNNSTTIDHMLAVTFYSDGHSEQKTTQYLVPPVSRNTISVSQYVYITSETTYVEVSMDVLECIDEYCDMSKTPEDRYYPADYQYYQSHSSTYIPRVVELTDEIYDLDDGEDIPRFTFEMEEVDFNGEMYYSIVVTSSQMNFATQCMEIIIHWIDANGESQMANWNLAYENGVYGFYPGNSNSTVTFVDSVDLNGDSAISSFGVGDIIFIKSEIGNQISVGAIRIDYAPDDMNGTILRSWDFGGGPIIDDDDNSEENTDDNDTEDDSESSGLPSIGVIGTLAAIGLSFVAVIRRDREE